jgi:O-acetyl-ADP-ribose deacetylase (regulator of RNase III)
LTEIAVIKGDITELDVEAIVNAANNSLLGGGGVDGAIHIAAGPQLVEECRKLGGCPTGEARITGGFGLSAKWIIHTVGPIWRGGNYKEDLLLSLCYKNCFKLIEEYEIKSVAFPSISTGAYGFPVGRASRIALKEMCSYKSNHNSSEVIAVCFNDRVYNSYLNVLKDFKKNISKV